MQGLKLKSQTFRREREAAWHELDELVTRMERGGHQALSAVELARLPALYRSAVSSLSVARAISLDRALEEYLASLCARGYLCLYAPRDSFAATARRFASDRLPRAVRSLKAELLIAAALLLIGAALGHVLTTADPTRFYAFVPRALAQGRDFHAAEEALRSPLYGGGESSSGELATFSMVLFSHNARLGLLAFALGFAGGIPSLYGMLSNGLTIGAFTALYFDRGMGVEFLAWLLPHGVTEFLALLLCGAAGLRLARALLFPGTRPRLDNLAAEGRAAGAVAIGAVLMLLLAGLIEGIFRQRVHDLGLRWAMAAATLTLWVTYFGLWGRGTEQ